VDGLPKSNHGQEGGISQVTKAAETACDRRAIPTDASEQSWATPDGFPIRVLDWPEPDGGGRGSLLFLPGRGDAYEKYLETFEHWRRRGWRVSSADWRGQAGSGRLGIDAVTGHVDDFSSWTRDLATLWRDWASGRSGPLVLVAHSMGGHLAMRAVAERALDPMPAALVLSAPMLDVLPERLPLFVKHAVARAMCAFGDPRRPAWKWSEKPGEVPAFRQALLTHDDERYADELYWRRARPELVMGPGSWGWVAAALTSIRMLEQPGVLEAIGIPVHLVATTADRLVGARAIRRAAARLPRVDAHWFGNEAAHEILREVDAVRGRALERIDRFLESLAPQ